MSIVTAQDNIFAIKYCRESKTFYIYRVLCWQNSGGIVEGLIVSNGFLKKISLFDFDCSYVKLSEDEAKVLDGVFDRNAGNPDFIKDFVKNKKFTYFNESILPVS